MNARQPLTLVYGKMRKALVSRSIRAIFLQKRFVRLLRLLEPSSLPLLPGFSVLIDSLVHTYLFFRTQGILRNVEIVERYAPNLARVYCDENQIKQVMINVLQNAVDAMPSGGVVHVESLQTEAQSITLRVKDQGSRMSEERPKHLGEPFYSSNEKGTGLGLTVSYEIIQQHGGAILIDSTVNQGTTLEITLPISNAISATK